MRTRIGALGLSALFALGAPACAAPPRVDTAARMERFIQSYVSSGRFMGAVLVARDDEVLLDQGYGSANLEWGVPNTPTTRFRIGSLTKQFTAACVLLLSERGQLTLEDPLSKYLPDTPKAWQPITLFHLLTHTSGIHNFTTLPEYRSLKVLPSAPLESIALLRGLPLDFPPGDRMQYSNSGYLLLGAIVERVSGMTYGEFVRKNILAPLGMGDSGLDSNVELIARRASGYTRTDHGPVNADYIHMSVPYSAGALYSTTGDLRRWLRALFGDQLLSAASLTKMTTPYKGGYGLGFEIDIVNGHQVVRHGGSIEGFNSYLAYYPETKVAVIVLGNLRSSAPEEMAPRLGAIANGDPVTLPSERIPIVVPVDTLKQYVGTYSIKPGVDMKVTLDGSQLVSQLSGQGRISLVAESPTVFHPTVIDAEIEFSVASDGRVSALLLRQGRQETRALKTSETVLERHEVELGLATLAAFVGTYSLESGLNLVISTEGQTLIIEPTGQPKDTLYAESDHEFFSKRIDAQIEFVRAPNGDVVGLVLHQGPVAARASRK